MAGRIELMQGTLDLMVLRTLEAMGPQHGYGLARRIEQSSGRAVLLNQGTIYAALVRLQQRGLMAASWGDSENGRRAKFYSLTPRGRKRLHAQAARWRRLVAVMGRVLAAEAARPAFSGRLRLAPAAAEIRPATANARPARGNAKPPREEP